MYWFVNEFSYRILGSKRYLLKLLHGSKKKKKIDPAYCEDGISEGNTSEESSKRR